MIVRIQVRRGTYTQWLNANPVLHSGEFGYETNTGRIKIGNGTDSWNDLSYLQGSGGVGEDGLSAYQIAVNNGFTGTEQEWLISLQGADGVDGANGKSAYDIAVQNGFAGTEHDWLESLSPIRFLDADIFEGDGETPETKTTIKDGSIEEGKLSEAARGKLGNEAVERESNTVLFDQDYIIGNSGPRAGDVLFDFTDAKLGSTIMMSHQDATPFTLPAECVVLNGSISDTAVNYIYFLLVNKTEGSEKVHVTISQEL